MKLALALAFLVAVTHAINCPSSWAEYKSVEEGSFRYTLENLNDEFYGI